MSPGSAVEHVKTRLSKLKRSSTTTLNKLRRRKSTESHGSPGSPADAAQGAAVTPGRRSLSDRSFRDSWFSRGSRHADDSTSVYSFRPHASSSESLASDARSGAAEAETKSVGSGSNATTVSDSTFPHTPDNSFKTEALPSDSEDHDQLLETPTITKSVSEDFIPVPDIIVDSTSLGADEQDCQESTAEEISFSSAEDDGDAHSELPAEPSGLSLMAIPLETIYEVDSVGGSQMGLSALPSTTSQYYSSSTFETSRDEAATSMLVGHAELSPKRRFVALESSPSDASLLRAISAAASPEVPSEASRTDSSDALGATRLADTNNGSDLSYDSLAAYTSGDSSYGAPIRPPGLGSDVFLADEAGGATSLLPSATGAFFPALPTDSSMASSASDESQDAPPGEAFVFPVEPTAGDKTNAQMDQDTLGVDASCDEASRSAAMSDISGIEYLPAQPVPVPSIQFVDVPQQPSDVQKTETHLDSVLSGVNHALESLPSCDPAASLFACDSAVFTTSTPASRSGVLPPDEDEDEHFDADVRSRVELFISDQATDASVSASSEASYGSPPAPCEEPLPPAVQLAPSAGQGTDAPVSASSEPSYGTPPACEEPLPPAVQPVPSAGQGIDADSAEDSSAPRSTPQAVSDDGLPSASEPMQQRPRSPTTRLSSCATLVFAAVGHSGPAPPSSYLAALPPILRLYTANRAIFLAHTPFAAPALVDSLSSSWHADDVD